MSKHLFKRINACFFIVSSLLLTIPFPSRADFFYFKDERGALHFTNVPDDPRYKNISQLKSEKTRKGYAPSNFNDYQHLIEKFAKKYQIDPLLIRALIRTESDYDPYAISKAGAQGLMQLMPETSRWMEVNDPFNPEENIEGGVKYFKRLFTIFNGRLVPSIAAYHAGEKLVQKFNNQIPPIETTQRYVKKVILQYYYYHGIKNINIPLNKIYQIETRDGDLIFTNQPDLYRQRLKEIDYR